MHGLQIRAIGGMDQNLIIKAKAIADRTDDVLKIANNLDLPQNIIAKVKQHYWVNKYLVNTDNGLYLSRFQKYERDIVLWEMAEEGFKNSRSYKEDGYDITITIEDGMDEFKKLLAHEYVESKLMEKGLNYSSMKEANNPTCYDFGAHDISPTFNHFLYNKNGRLDNPVGVDYDKLSNLEKIINSLIEYYKL